MSFFKDVIGQEDVKQLLIHSAKNGKMPHAVLLTGPAGSGKLPVALAVARYLLCHHPAENDACGQCNSCKMMDHLAHPDMHFAFPVVRKKAGRDVVCDEFLPQWPVDGHAYQPGVLFEEFAPLIRQQGTVGLDTVVDGTSPGIFLL